MGKHRYIIGTCKYRLKTLLFGDARYRCMLCGAEVFDNYAICSSCARLMPYNNGKTCLRCGSSLDGQELYCINCSHGNNNIDKAYSVYIYQDSVPKIIHKVKFGKSADLTLPMAYMLADKAKSANIQYDVVCNVPMTSLATKIRGYNQSQLLAKYFCDIMDRQYCDALVKLKNTTPQEQLSRSVRRTNVVGAFAADKTMVSGKTVLLIDDVMTTGATLDNCAKALKKAGASMVYCLCVASGKIRLNMEDNDGNI